jgi:hypothetical protein
MDLLVKLFGELLGLIYHCFDCIVIHGYLTGLSRPEHDCAEPSPTAAAPTKVFRD